jgi:hypothetical protein
LLELLRVLVVLAVEVLVQQIPPQHQAQPIQVVVVVVRQQLVIQVALAVAVS